MTLLSVNISLDNFGISEVVKNKINDNNIEYSSPVKTLNQKSSIAYDRFLGNRNCTCKRRVQRGPKSGRETL